MGGGGVRGKHHSVIMHSLSLPTKSPPKLLNIVIILFRFVNLGKGVWDMMFGRDMQCLV